jgi:hypothetical protein
MQFYINNKLKDFTHSKYEFLEVLIAREFVQQNDCVLELGGGIGRIAVEINKKLSNPKNHVVVEPNSSACLDLTKNKDIHKSEFNIVQGSINEVPQLLDIPLPNNPIGFTGGYTLFDPSRKADLTIKPYSLKYARSLVDSDFTVLFADCEGCLNFFSQRRIGLNFLQNLRLVFFERDNEKICSYNKFEFLLNELKFDCIRSGFHNVYINKSFRL